jgi:hypothetical protein
MEFALKYALNVNFQNLTLLYTAIIIQLLYETWDPKDHMNWCYMLCSLACAEETCVRMTTYNQNIYRELMVIKVTVAPTGTYAVFVYQTGYI